jgi:hypothetical protein
VIRTAPRDAALPELARLLSEDEMAEVLQRALGEGAPLPDVRIAYLRYKPQTNIVVQYKVAFARARHVATAMIAAGDVLARRATKAESRALAQMVNGRSPSPRPLVFDADVRCLIQWYPLDLALPALAEAPEALCRRLRSLGVPIPVTTREPARLAYKPRRRAVLALGDTVLKCYAKDSAFVAAAAAQQASSGLSSLVVPTFLGVVPSHRLTAQSLLRGRRVGAGPDAASAAGAVLAALHASDLRPDWLGVVPVARPEDQLTAAASSASLVVAVAPELQPRVESLLRDLEASMPEAGELVPTHGDFNVRQLLLVDGELAVTDFDEFCLAPPALDLATYVAYAVRADPAPPAAEGVLDDLIRGYGRRPPALGWYLATMMLRRAPRPFRYFEPGWPAGVEAMVGAAEEALVR